MSLAGLFIMLTHIGRLHFSSSSNYTHHQLSVFPGETAATTLMITQTSLTRADHTQLRVLYPEIDTARAAGLINVSKAVYPSAEQCELQPQRTQEPCRKDFQQLDYRSHTWTRM
jgi:hypothetical protein